MKMLKSVSILSFIASQALSPAFSQWLGRISWTPPEPTSNDEIVIHLWASFADYGGRLERVTFGQNDNFALELHLYIVELNGVWPQEGVPFELEQNAGRLEAGAYTIMVRSHFRGEDEERYIDFDERQARMTVSDQIIAIAVGWNLISANFNPNNRQLPALFGNLIENGSLTLVKDDAGRIFYPARNINQIGDWNGLEGYWVNMAHTGVLQIIGERIPADVRIELEAGWNQVAYTVGVEVPAATAFHNIEDVLQIAKDERGNFYMPAINFNNMPPLQAGKGYQVRVSETCELMWNVP